MSDELDPGLRRLFASTAEAPADEAFVAGVTAQTVRERRLRLLGRALIGLAILAVILAAISAGVLGAVNRALGDVALLVSAPPLGWVAGVALALAGAICIRTLGPLLVRR